MPGLHAGPDPAVLNFVDHRVDTQCQINILAAMNSRPISRAGKKEKVRQALIKAAMELFAKKGFENTTVDEIVAAAEVSRRTFFRYFPAKELVMFPHQDAYYARFRELLADHNHGEPPFTTVRAACLRMAEVYMSARDEHLAQQRIIQSSPMLIARGDQFDEELEALITKTLMWGRRGDKDYARLARVIAGSTLGAIRVVMREWYAGECRKDLRKLGAQAFALLELGILNFDKK